MTSRFVGLKIPKGNTTSPINAWIVIFAEKPAPTIFARNDDSGYAYVVKQPNTEQELRDADEATEYCPCEAIKNDGDQFDWAMIPTRS